ncbi:hypothetical protein LINPERHAP1_LOCUS9468 [Linum perenne]
MIKKVKKNMEYGENVIAFIILDRCYRAVQKHVSNQSTNIQE